MWTTGLVRLTASTLSSLLMAGCSKVPTRVANSPNAAEVAQTPVASVRLARSDAGSTPKSASPARPAPSTLLGGGANVQSDANAASNRLRVRPEMIAEVRRSLREFGQRHKRGTASVQLSLIVADALEAETAAQAHAILARLPITVTRIERRDANNRLGTESQYFLRGQPHATRFVLTGAISSDEARSASPSDASPTNTSDVGADAIFAATRVS